MGLHGQDVQPATVAHHQTCEHVWKFVGVSLIAGEGAPTEYECAECGAVMRRAAGEPLPRRPVWDS